MTPQDALRLQMQSMVSKVEKDTGVAFPKYYNPAAVNPAKLAEITKKRKMLWSGSGDSEKEVQYMQYSYNEFLFVFQFTYCTDRMLCS